VETLCNRLERHAAAFILSMPVILSMLKTNAAAWRFHGVLDSTLLATLWGFLGRRGRVVSAPRARCKDAVYILQLG